MRRRVIITISLVIIMALAVAARMYVNATRNAPIQLNQGDITEEAIIESDGESIPLGVPPSTIMVVSDIGEDWDIVLLKADGTSLNLTADASGAQDLAASFSLDGTAINFISNRTNPEALGPSQVKPDGSDLRNLTVIGAVMTLVSDAQFDWDPIWSPDGESLAWVSLRDFNLEIYTTPLEATIDFDEATRQTQSGARDWYASWSPDGTQIAYNSDADGNENIYILDVATSESTQLTTHEADDYQPFWLRDGSSLLFISERENKLTTGIVDVYEMNIDGSDLRPFDNRTIEADPRWSPTGQHVAYMSNDGETWHIYVEQSDGSNTRRITDGDANFAFPVWMP